jgi:hypothetical protein
MVVQPGSELRDRAGDRGRRGLDRRLKDDCESNIGPELPETPGPSATGIGDPLFGFFPGHYGDPWSDDQ